MASRRRFLLLATALLAAAAWGLEVGGCGARSALDPPGGAVFVTGPGDQDDGGPGSNGESGGSGTGSQPGDDSGDGGSSSSGSGSSSFSSVGTACVPDAGAAAPSCMGGGAGLDDCGSCNETCCASFGVTGVTYSRTYTNAGSGAFAEGDPATISSLRLDRYLVTVGRFRQFVSAWNNGSGYMPPVGSGVHTQLNGGQGLAAAGSPGMYEQGWDSNDDGYLDPTDGNLTQCTPASTWTPAPSSGTGESLPINCVNWWEAYAFCIWDGGFLPSEAEWEMAAAGGDQQREYPWGTSDPGSANEYAIYGASASDCYFPTSGACTGVANIAPVGTAAQGAGLYGQLDLAGNVGEWTLDWFAPYVDPCVDCAQLEFASLRSIRGGSYEMPAPGIPPPVRAGRYPPGRTGDVGFRCARLP